MKSYKNIWEDFLSDDNIKLAMHEARRGKKNRHSKKRLVEMENNPERFVPILRERAKNYYNASHKPVIIYDGITRKQREIIVPKPIEQVVHHMCVNKLQPIFMKSMYQHAYGSVPGRGATSGMKRIKKWLPAKYFLKMDIKKYFQNVDQQILIKQLERRIKDEQFMHVLKVIISAVPKGIPLGFYTSQWFANFYLTGLDHYISTELGYGHYIRYMDDMVIFSDSREDLHRARRLIQEYLETELNLTLKDNWQVCRFDYVDEEGVVRGRPLDFMGYKFYRNRVTLRKSILQKSRRKANHIYAKTSRGVSVTWYDSSQMLSYLGWYDYTDSYRYFEKYISPKVNIKQLKRTVSKKSKRRQEYYDSLQRSRINREAA